jgi:hypothetical protein
MTPGGNKFQLTYNTGIYYFDTFQLSCNVKIEETPLLDATLYRKRAGVGRNTLKLTSRLTFGNIPIYKRLIDAFATGVRTFNINLTEYTGWTLLSGKIISEEGKPFMTCELILTEVSE